MSSNDSELEEKVLRLYGALHERIQTQMEICEKVGRDLALLHERVQQIENRLNVAPLH